MAPNRHIDALTALGLTALEATLYAHLLQHPRATGYAIAKGVGKPTANTYKALDSLRGKGAVVVGGGARRRYRAVPPDELLDALERRFLDHRRNAAAGLAALAAPRADDRIYELHTAEQVVERLRNLLRRARRVAVLDLAPWAVAQVAADIAFAAAAATVVARVYEPVTIEGADVVVTDAPKLPAPRTAPVNAVVDGREMLLSTISADGTAVHGAIWTANADIAGILHRALAAENFFAAVETRLAEGLSTDELEETFEEFRRLRDA